MNEFQILNAERSVVHHVPQDAVREFYLKTISLHVNRSLDDLASFATEKQILRHMKRMPPPGRGAMATAAGLLSNVTPAVLGDGINWCHDDSNDTQM